MEEKTPRIGCVILAAGNGLRFGGNKLLAEFRGRPLIEWAIGAIPPPLYPDTVVVTQYADVEKLAAAKGLRVLRNPAPELGVSHSVALGTAALKDVCGGILFLVADQPLLRRETVQRLIDAWIAAAQDQLPTFNYQLSTPPRPPIAAVSADGRRGNPCLFPADLFPDLEALTGDRGGSQIIRKHPDRVFCVEADPEELADVDTASALTALEDPR